MTGTGQAVLVLTIPAVAVLRVPKTVIRVAVQLLTIGIRVPVAPVPTPAGQVRATPVPTTVAKVRVTQVLMTGIVVPVAQILTTGAVVRSLQAPITEVVPVPALTIGTGVKPAQILMFVATTDVPAHRVIAVARGQAR